MLFQACQVMYISQSLWNDGTIHFISSQSPLDFSYDSSLRPILTIVDCMIYILFHQVSYSFVAMGYGIAIKFDG